MGEKMTVAMLKTPYNAFDRAQFPEIILANDN
jgi:hypothetical protein